MVIIFFSDQLTVIGRYDGSTERYSETTAIPWPNGAPPPDIPECGFDGSKCKAGESIKNYKNTQIRSRVKRKQFS